MDGKEYVQCRLSGETHKRLHAIAREFRRKARENPQGFLPSLTEGRCGLSDVIDQLVFNHDKETVRKSSHAQWKTDPPPVTVDKRLDADLTRLADDGSPLAAE